MRVNIYAEELTDRVEIISKEIDGRKFTGLRFYLVNERPADMGTGRRRHWQLHGDDDSSAVTFWGKQDLRDVLRKAMAMLDKHYDNKI